jgi:hypothetical protein
VAADTGADMGDDDELDPAFLQSVLQNLDPGNVDAEVRARLARATQCGAQACVGVVQ